MQNGIMFFYPKFEQKFARRFLLPQIMTYYFGSACSSITWIKIQVTNTYFEKSAKFFLELKLPQKPILVNYFGCALKKPFRHTQPLYVQDKSVSLVCETALIPH